MKFSITAWSGGKTPSEINAIFDAQRLSRELYTYLSSVTPVFGWFIGRKGLLIAGDNKTTFGLFVDGCDLERPVAEFNADNYAGAYALAADIIIAYSRAI